MQILCGDIMAVLELMLAVGNRAYADKLKLFFEDAGHCVIDVATDGNECLRKLNIARPDMIIIDYELPPSNGYYIAKIIDEDRICGGILLLSEGQQSIIQDDFNLTNFAYFTKPLNKNMLLSTLEIIHKSSRKIIKLEKEIENLKDTLETRKEVEKAKGILMDVHSISEAEAFRRMQKQSMDKGIPLKEIAKAIIIAYKL